jgi:hypothetical protein
MKGRGVIAILLTILALVCAARAAELGKLRVLYIGDETSSRAQDFKGFLEKHVATVDLASRTAFDPARASGLDVVLLDWPQNSRGEKFPPTKSPLGERENWSKPTVLLGSAGLHMAIVWKAKGGVG